MKKQPSKAMKSNNNMKPVPKSRKSSMSQNKPRIRSKNTNIGLPTIKTLQILIHRLKPIKDIKSKVPMSLLQLPILEIIPLKFQRSKIEIETVPHQKNKTFTIKTQALPS